MGDLKTFWDDPGMPMSTDLGGDTVVSSGSDPSVSVEGENPIKPFWPNPPSRHRAARRPRTRSAACRRLPNRFEPSDQPPPPPTLQDRRPGTIDEQ